MRGARVAETRRSLSNDEEPDQRGARGGVAPDEHRNFYEPAHTHSRHLVRRGPRSQKRRPSHTPVTQAGATQAGATQPEAPPTGRAADTRGDTRQATDTSFLYWR